MGYSLLPPESLWHERTETTLLERLGTHALEEARSRGSALDQAEAVAYALSIEHPRPGERSVCHQFR